VRRFTLLVTKFVVSIKDTQTEALKKGAVSTAVVVQKEVRRADGYIVRFDDNACAFECCRMRGTRVLVSMKNFK
jgi:ribosomal protein L14